MKESTEQQALQIYSEPRTNANYREQLIKLLRRDFDLYEKLPVSEFIEILKTNQTFRTRDVDSSRTPD